MWSGTVKVILEVEVGVEAEDEWKARAEAEQRSCWGDWDVCISSSAQEAVKDKPKGKRNRRDGERS